MDNSICMQSEAQWLLEARRHLAAGCITSLLNIDVTMLNPLQGRAETRWRPRNALGLPPESKVCDDAVVIVLAHETARLAAAPLLGGFSTVTSDFDFLGKLEAASHKVIFCSANVVGRLAAQDGAPAAAQIRGTVFYRNDQHHSVPVFEFDTHVRNYAPRFRGPVETRAVALSP